MRKLIVSEFLTLDGVMQAPGNKDEDNEGGFTNGGWQVPFFEDAGEAMGQAFEKTGALMLGSKTYAIFAAYWPNASKDMPVTEFMNNIPKYVASRARTKLEWQNSHLLEGNIAATVKKLKQEDGKDIQVVGSGDFAQTLMRENLIDEYFLMIHPLVLGGGKRLFREDSPKQDLEMINSKTTKNGVLILTYKVKR